MPVRFHSSTDWGAPVLMGRAGSLTALLRALLVDGIGSSPQNPWDMLFEDFDTYGAVFRAPDGVRPCLQVMNSAKTRDRTQRASVRAFSNMIDFWNGYDKCPAYPYVLSKPQRGSADLIYDLTAEIADEDNTRPRPWRAVVSSTGFHLFIFPGWQSLRWQLFSFGTFEDWRPSGALPFYLAGDIRRYSSIVNRTYDAARSMYQNPAYGVGIFTPRDYNGQNIITECGISYDASIVGNLGVIVPGSGGQVYPYGADDALLVLPFLIGSSSQVFGRVPGLWIPAHARPIQTGTFFYAVIGGVTRRLLAQEFYNGGMLFLETSDTWGA